MITLTLANQTGFFSVTHGANGVISSTGPVGPQSRIKASYSFSGATSGVYAGLAVWDDNFAEAITFPGSTLQFELVAPDDYCGVNIEVVEF